MALLEPNELPLRCRQFIAGSNQIIPLWLVLVCNEFSTAHGLNRGL